MKVGIIYIYDFIDQGAISANGLRQSIEEFEAQGVDEFEMHINSNGGSVFEGIAIYNYLKGKNLTVYIDGIAASTASLIAMAGKKIKMYSSSMMMIHNPWILSAGDSKELQKQGKTLDQVKTSIIEVYSERTYMSKSRISDLMDAETFLSAKEAVSKGFADEIVKMKDLTKQKNYIGLYVDLFDDGSDNNENNKTGDSKMNKALLKFLGFTDEEISKSVKDEQIEIKLSTLRTENGLDENADLNTILAAISKKKEEPAKPENSTAQLTADQKMEKFLADQKKEKIESYVNQAVADGKIAPAEKTAYLAYAEKDFTACKTELDAKAKNSAVPGKVNIPQGKVEETAKPKTLAELKAEATAQFKAARVK